MHNYLLQTSTLCYENPLQPHQKHAYERTYVDTIGQSRDDFFHK
jgi:hypothetical protein